MAETVTGWGKKKKKKGLGSTLYFVEENFAVRLCRFNEHINLDCCELFSPFLGVTSGWTIKFLREERFEVVGGVYRAALSRGEYIRP